MGRFIIVSKEKDADGCSMFLCGDHPKYYFAAKPIYYAWSHDNESLVKDMASRWGGDVIDKTKLEYVPPEDKDFPVRRTIRVNGKPF